MVKKQTHSKLENILELLQNQIEFLKGFSSEELQYIFATHDIIVFTKETTLAKQNQLIDYWGVILNGSAYCEKSKSHLKKGSVIGNVLSLGLQTHQKHCQNIVGQSEGILLALRMESLLSTAKSQVEQSSKAKVLEFMAERNLCDLMEAHEHFSSKLEFDFEELSEKVIHKMVQGNRFLADFLEQFEPKEKAKLLELYPIYCVKQKTQIVSKNSKPYLLILIKGEIALKYGLGLKKETKLVGPGTVYNCEGFLFGHTEYVNGFCTSNEAVFMLVEKDSFMSNFKIGAQAALYKYCLEVEVAEKSYSQVNTVKQETELSQDPATQNKWYPFMKCHQIQQLPHKTEKANPRNTKSQTGPQTKAKKESLSNLQSLYKAFYHSKNKTKTKETLITEHNELTTQGSKMGTLKTDFSQDLYSSSAVGDTRIKNLEAEVQQLKEQNKLLTDTNKKLRLQELESSSKLKMAEVFKQIRSKAERAGDSVFKEEEISRGTLSQFGQSSQFGAKQKGQTGQSATLKQVFQSNLKKKKIDILVAKCAYKWLSVTRQSRRSRENEAMTNSILIKSASRMG